MGGGRQPDKVWKYAEANPNKAEAVKKPYVDVFQKVSHSDNATKFKLFLVFDCPEFMKTKPLEWTELVAGLTEKNVQQRKESDVQQRKATWRQCVRSVQQCAAGRASAGEQGSHLPNALTKAGAYGGSIAAAGLSAAKLQVLPQQPWAEDALNCLKERVKVLPADEQQKVIRGYNKLVAGEVHFDEDELASADDVPLRIPRQTYRENGGEELRLLSLRVLERLYELRPAQAGVEELNSCCKFIQAGRQSLLTVNAREAQQLRKAGRAGRALAKEERKRAKKAKKAAVVSSESESESDSGASDDDDSHAIELDDDSDDSAGARSGEGEE
jgi:hypothetical protein